MKTDDGNFAPCETSLPSNYSSQAHLLVLILGMIMPDRAGPFAPTYYFGLESKHYHSHFDVNKKLCTIVERFIGKYSAALSRS